jgi:hypothetical protein
MENPYGSTSYHWRICSDYFIKQSADDDFELNTKIKQEGSSIPFFLGNFLLFREKSFDQNPAVTEVYFLCPAPVSKLFPKVKEEAQKGFSYIPVFILYQSLFSFQAYTIGGA